MEGKPREQSIDSDQIGFLEIKQKTYSSRAAADALNKLQAVEMDNR